MPKLFCHFQISGSPSRLPSSDQYSAGGQFSKGKIVKIFETIVLLSKKKPIKIKACYTGYSFSQVKEIPVNYHLIVDIPSMRLIRSILPSLSLHYYFFVKRRLLKFKVIRRRSFLPAGDSFKKSESPAEYRRNSNRDFY